MMNQFKSKNKGMTMVELVMAISIFVVIMGGVAMFQYNVFSFSSQVSDSLETAADAQAILKTIEKEIRTMSPGSDGSYPIVQAGTSTITFYSDVDGDGLKERVRFFLSGTSLNRGYIKPSINPVVYNPASEKVSLVVKNIRNGTSTPTFEYYGDQYVYSSSPYTYPINLSSIKLVKVSLTADANPSRSPVSRTYTSYITLRNLKDNL